MAIVLRSSLESWMFQAGRFVWEQTHRERSGPSVPQLRAALVRHSTAAARAETRAELTRELRGVFEAALGLAAERGIARTELERPRSARDPESKGTVAPASVPERPRSGYDWQSSRTLAAEWPHSGRDLQSGGTVASERPRGARFLQTEMSVSPERPRARKVLDRVAALRSTASDVLEAPSRARKVLSDLGSSVVRGIQRREVPEPPPHRPRARRVLDRVAGPMTMLDRVAELGSSVVGVATPAAVVFDRVVDLGASVADAADRGANAVIRGATAAIGGGSTGASSARPAPTNATSLTRVSAVSGAWRVDAVMSRWLSARRHEPSGSAAIGGKRGAVRWVASQLSSLDQRGYASHARFALRARWPVLRERRWFGRRQRQFKVTVEQRSKGTMLATIPASPGAQLAAWAVTTTSRFVLERWVLPYLMRKVAPLRVAPVASKLLWGFGRVAVPTGLRLLARTPTRAR